MSFPTKMKLNMIAIIFVFLLAMPMILADTVIESYLECQNETENVWEGFEVVGTRTIEYRANVTITELEDGTLDYRTVRYDCSKKGDYSNPENNLTVGYCHTIDNETAECRTRVETPPNCKNAGQTEKAFFSYLGEEGWYDVCYRSNQSYSHNINGYSGCVNGEPMIDAAGCVKEGQISYDKNVCFTESQNKTCEPEIGWTCDLNDEPQKVDCDDYVVIDNATNTIENYRVSKESCNLDNNGQINCSGSDCCVHETLVCDNDKSDEFAVGYPAFVQGDFMFCLKTDTGYELSREPNSTMQDSLLCTGEDLNRDGFIDNNASYCSDERIYQKCDFYVPNLVPSQSGDTEDVCIEGEVADCYVGPGYEIGCDSPQFVCLENKCINNSKGKIKGIQSDIEIFEQNITTIDSLSVEFSNYTLEQKQRLVFKDLKRQIIDSEIDFDTQGIDFKDIVLGTQNCTEGYGWTLVQGLPELNTTTKEMYVDRINKSDRVCVRDAPTTTIGEVSSGCGGPQEIYFSQCDASGQTVTKNGNTYTCQFVVNENGFEQYKITGLHHSGGVEVLGEGSTGGDDGQVNIPEFNGSSVLLALILTVIGLVVIRRRN